MNTKRFGFHAGTRLGALLVACLAASACGDVAADLITGPGSAAPPTSPSDGGSAGGGEGGSPPASGGSAQSGGSAGAVGAGECLSNAECTEGELRVCDTVLQRCVECLDDAFCRDEAEECSSVLAACAHPCESAEDCEDDEPICETRIGDTATTGYCVECRENEECESGICRDFECSE